MYLKMEILRAHIILYKDPLSTTGKSEQLKVPRKSSDPEDSL